MSNEWYLGLLRMLGSRKQTAVGTLTRGGYTSHFKILKSEVKLRCPGSFFDEQRVFGNEFRRVFDRSDFLIESKGENREIKSKKSVLIKRSVIQTLLGCDPLFKLVNFYFYHRSLPAGVGKLASS